MLRVVFLVQLFEQPLAEIQGNNSILITGCNISRPRRAVAWCGLEDNVLNSDWVRAVQGRPRLGLRGLYKEMDRVLD